MAPIVRELNESEKRCSSSFSLTLSITFALASSALAFALLAASLAFSMAVFFGGGSGVPAHSEKQVDSSSAGWDSPLLVSFLNEAPNEDFFFGFGRKGWFSAGDTVKLQGGAR